MAGATKAPRPRTSGNDEAQAFDAILRSLEGSLAKADAQQNAAVASVKFQGIVVDLFTQLEAARSLMMQVLQSENVKRTVLQHVFGGDCVRISRARAVVETALQMDYGTGRNQMAEECLRACESVEQVLGDLGLGFSLRKAQVQERELLQRRRHGVAVAAAAVPVNANRSTAATSTMVEDLTVPLPSLETSPTEPSTVQPSTAEPSPAEPSPAEPSPSNEPSPPEPSPAEPSPSNEPSPPEPSPAELSPPEPSPAVPSPSDEPSPAEPSPAVPRPAEPSAAEPRQAEPSPAELNPVELSESSVAEEVPSEQNSAEPSTGNPAAPSTEPSPVEASPVEASPVEASSVEDELQLCSVEPRSSEVSDFVDEVNEADGATGYPAGKGSAEARPSKSSKTRAGVLTTTAESRRDEKTEPEAEPLLAPSRRSSGRSEDPRSEGLQPIRFAPHLAALVGRVFLHYASGDCTAGMGGLSSTRFRCFLRDCSILSSDPGETLQRWPSSSDVAMDRRSPAGLVVSPSRSQGSQGSQGPRKMSRQLSGSFTAGFGTTAEAAAAESGKLPLALCAAPVLTRAQADLVYIQAMKQQEVHMTQESFLRALVLVGQQCLSGVDADVPRDDASILNWFCQWALVPLAEALGISQHDVLCAAEILRDPEVSALLRSCQRGLHIVFARYAMASPAPREPYRKGFWTVQSMQRFAAESEISAELSHQCLQWIFTGCVQHECSLERKTLPGKMSSSCFLLALIVIAQRVHSAPGCTPLKRVAMFMLRLSICRGASDLGVAARRVLGKAKR